MQNIWTIRYNIIVKKTQSRVAEYETERYKPENITLGAAINLANALGCTLDELFTSEEQTE